MPIYVIIAQKDADPPVGDLVDDRDKCEVRPGVWLVRSELSTSAEVSKFLKIDRNSLGIVVAAKNFSGFSESRVVDKIVAWETD